MLQIDYYIINKNVLMYFVLMYLLYHELKQNKKYLHKYSKNILLVLILMFKTILLNYIYSSGSQFQQIQ